MSDEPEMLNPPERLGRLRPRDTRAARINSIRNSRIVDVLRWLLPVIILFGIGALLAWPMWHDNQISAVMVDNVPNLMVEKLNLTGTDTKGQAYALTADRALQAANTKNIVDLDKPKGEIQLSGGAWVAGHADRGRLDQGSNKLWLGGNVELFHDQGYRFTSDEMNVDMKTSTAWGLQPITIQGPFGTIAGGGFRLLDAGATIVITGPAKARLSLQRMGPSAKPKNAKPNVNPSTSR